MREQGSASTLARMAKDGDVDMHSALAPRKLAPCGTDAERVARCAEASLRLLERNLTPRGVLAATPSPQAEARSYTRIFGRDGAICTLAAAPPASMRWPMAKPPTGRSPSTSIRKVGRPTSGISAASTPPCGG